MFPRHTRSGCRSRWLLGDLDHLLIRLRRSDRDLPDTVPSKLQTLVDFLKFVPRQACATTCSAATTRVPCSTSFASSVKTISESPAGMHPRSGRVAVRGEHAGTIG